MVRYILGTATNSNCHDQKKLWGWGGGHLI
jgi:hypothetical protein